MIRTLDRQKINCCSCLFICYKNFCYLFHRKIKCRKRPNLVLCRETPCPWNNLVIISPTLPGKTRCLVKFECRTDQIHQFPCNHMFSNWMAKVSFEGITNSVLAGRWGVHRSLTTSTNGCCCAHAKSGQHTSIRACQTKFQEQSGAVHTCTVAIVLIAICTETTRLGQVFWSLQNKVA